MLAFWEGALEYEYETEKSDRQVADEDALHEIRHKLKHDPDIPEFFSIGGNSIDTRDLVEDQRKFRSQQRKLVAGQEYALAVRFKANSWPNEGEELLVVESMKMENAIRAPKDGVVKSVAAHAGDMVGPGIVLVELE